MNIRRLAVRLSIPLSVIVVVPSGVHAQVDQHALAQQLLAGNLAERSRALAAVESFGPQNTGPELRGALITLLERNNRIVVEAARRNQALATVEDPEFIAHVGHVVSGLKDPQAIPALAGALGTGSTLVTTALADFGEPAVAPVLRVVTSPRSRDYAVGEGLIALRFMVEGRATRPLSTSALDEIKSAAKQRLSGKQDVTTLWWAIDLAAALQDPELRRIIDSLASNRAAVVARGIEEPDLIRDTQRQAAERLAGVPAKPRRP